MAVILRSTMASNPWKEYNKEGKTGGVAAILQSGSREGRYCKRHLSPFKNHKDHSSFGLVPTSDAALLPSQ